MSDIDDEIDWFLKFWELHGSEPELRVFEQVIHSPGCNGDFGCCSKHYDMSRLVEALQELAGRIGND